MIADYDNDEIMARLGRNSARYKAIKTAREGIRDYAVMLGYADNVQEIEKYQVGLNSHIANLIEVLTLKDK